MTIDITALPPPPVIETLAFEAILADIKADFLGRYPDAAATIDLESDPINKLMQTLAYRELLWRARSNDEARALLLAFSTGADLDHIGATYYQEARLTITPANPATVPPTAAVMEQDDDYRQRLAMKPESWSTAGPTGAYEWHARSASGLVKDAKATSPQPGTTQVFILSRTGNGAPDAGLLATVAAALNAEDTRPLSEEVIVSAATLVNYTLDITPTLWAGPTAEPALPAMLAALQKFAEAKHKLKTDIDKSAIDAAAHVPGVKSIEIHTPLASIVCSAGQAPYCTGITLRPPVIVSP